MGLSQAGARLSTFTAWDGFVLAEHRWDVAGPRAHVVLCHGGGEHLGYYGNLAAALNVAGISASGIDLRGHGRSPMPWRDLSSYRILVDDLAAYVRSQAQSEVPVFAIAHSMGGCFALILAAEHRLPVRGLVTSGAATRVSDDLAPAARRIAGLLSRVAPSLPVVRVATKSSCNPQVQAAYDADRLVPKRIPARFAAEALAATRDCGKHLDSVDVPLLILHGTADQLSDPVGAQLLYERSRSADKTLRLLDGWCHKLFWEPERDRIITELITWIDARVDGETTDPVPTPVAPTRSMARVEGMGLATGSAGMPPEEQVSEIVGTLGLQ